MSKEDQGGSDCVSQGQVMITSNTASVASVPQESLINNSDAKSTNDTNDAACLREGVSDSSSNVIRSENVRMDCPENEQIRFKNEGSIKVPDIIDIYFWIIKVCCTTVGETFADFLNVDVGLGLDKTAYIMVSLLIFFLVIQFLLSTYNGYLYWFVVVLMSVAGTLVTDELTDNANFDLWKSNVLFFSLMVAIFATWYYSEGTLDIHSIRNTKREAFYWAAVLFAFACGTAAGDLLAERADLGYWLTLIVFVSSIIATFLVWITKLLPTIPCFWVAYILTRPLGASMGDLLSQDVSVGGFGLGTQYTSVCLAALIISTVIIAEVKHLQQGETLVVESVQDPETGIPSVSESLN